MAYIYLVDAEEIGDTRVRISVEQTHNGVFLRAEIPGGASQYLIRVGNDGELHICSLDQVEADELGIKTHGESSFPVFGESE